MQPVFFTTTNQGYHTVRHGEYAFKTLGTAAVIPALPEMLFFYREVPTGPDRGVILTEARTGLAAGKAPNRAALQRVIAQYLRIYGGPKGWRKRLKKQKDAPAADFIA